MTEVDPIVTAELAKLLLAIEDAVDNIVPVSLGKVKVSYHHLLHQLLSVLFHLHLLYDPSNVIFPLPNFIALAASTTPKVLKL